MTTPPLSTVPDGLTELAPGKIAAIATYLETRERPAALPRPPEDVRFDRMSGDLPRYRRLYGAVGEPWLWFSRTLVSDHELAGILRHPDVEPWALVRDGRDLGLFELDFRTPGQCELAFLGLVPEACGGGLGRILLAEAQRRAFARPIERLWLHTCTLDHPAAVPLYLSGGLRPYRRAIEIADDPRLAGRLPREAAPHFPPLPRARRP